MRYFVAVAEELHFGRAAERLNLAQQPLSAAIKRLETQLGVPLFRRSSRRVELTEAGRVYLTEVRVILKSTADAAEAARRAARGETGQLSIGYKSGALNNLLPGVIRRFRDRYPQAQLSLHEWTSPEVEAALSRQQVQVGLLCAPGGDPALRAETVLREPLVLALPAAHPLASLTRVPLRLLAGEEIVRCDRAISPHIYDAITALFHAAGVAPRVTQEVATEAALVGLVSAGLGTGFVSASQGRMPVAGTTYRPLDGPSVEVDLAMAWRRDDRSPLTAAFLQVVREAGGQGAAAAPSQVQLA